MNDIFSESLLVNGLAALLDLNIFLFFLKRITVNILNSYKQELVRYNKSP